MEQTPQLRDTRCESVGSSAGSCQLPPCVGSSDTCDDANSEINDGPLDKTLESLSFIVFLYGF